MHEDYNLDIIKQLISEERYSELTTLLEPLHPTEVAEILSNYPYKLSKSVLDEMSRQRRADVFCEFSFSDQTEIASFFSTKELVSMLRSLSPDDRVDLLKSLPEDQYDTVLPALAKKEREDLIKLASYEEGSAGSAMTTDYIAFPQNLHVQQAIERIRLEGARKEAIYSIYVVDDERKLCGSLTLTNLILAPPHRRLSEVMDDQVISVPADSSQEEAIYAISRYDLVSLPVVDENGRLLGRITHDDAFDLIEEERTEDMERFMAISGKHEDVSYLKTSTWSHFKRRVVWLVILSVFGLISGAILQSFESTLMNLMILAFYMPMLADTGGNTGSQAATVMVRALALKEISPKNVLKIIWKELRVALMLAVVLGSLAFIRVILTSSSEVIPQSITMIQIGIAIASALAVQVVSATVIGALLPLGAASLKLDPALVASPALTTMVDITGLLIYFTTVKLILGI